MTESLYDELGVTPDVTVGDLRRAYRERALRHHPDRLGGDVDRMAAVNRAWAVLSDPTRRASYDQSLPSPSPAATAPGAQQGDVAPGSGFYTARRTWASAPGSHKEAWFAGIRLQIMRLGSEAARSATQALALKRHGRARAVYDMHLDGLVQSLSQDTPERVRLAREAGAAPLDLGLASALVGLHELADEVERSAARSGITEHSVILAELIDKTWDNLAHGVSHEIEQALGGNPRLLRTLTGRRV
ncbi:MAG: curved DNA-binding protein CbpA [Candidatus Poriferisodalaceae bacterium]|jgi:curved DNA-binding protein CbpA